MPKVLPAAVLPQFLALEKVIRYIFDREACLLPGYFVINEIFKVYQMHKEVNVIKCVVYSVFFMHLHR